MLTLTAKPQVRGMIPPNIGENLALLNNGGNGDSVTLSTVRRPWPPDGKRGQPNAPEHDGTGDARGDSAGLCGPTNLGTKPGGGGRIGHHGDASVVAAAHRPPSHPQHV